MEKHQLNIARQYVDNTTHLRNLDGFCASPRFQSLPPAHCDAILWQRDAMRELNAALKRRMELFGLPV